VIVSVAILGAVEAFIAFYLRTARQSQRTVLSVIYRRLRFTIRSLLVVNALAIPAFPRSAAFIALIVLGTAATAALGSLQWS
jgi:hypothetical protein